MYTKGKASGMGVVGINPSIDKQPEINSFWKEFKLNFTGAMAPRDTAKKYGVMAYPSNYVVDKTGKIVWRGVGFDPEGMKAALKKLGVKL